MHFVLLALEFYTFNLTGASTIGPLGARAPTKKFVNDLAVPTGTCDGHNQTQRFPTPENWLRFVPLSMMHFHPLYHMTGREFPYNPYSILGAMEKEGNGFPANIL